VGTVIPNRKELPEHTCLAKFEIEQITSKRHHLLAHGNEVFAISQGKTPKHKTPRHCELEQKQNWHGKV
jgi:hypothetical protein